MANNIECIAYAKFACEQYVEKKKSSSKARGKKKKKATFTNTVTLAKDIATALRVGTAPPTIAAPGAGTAVVTPVIQVPHGQSPGFNGPHQGNQLVSDCSFVGGTNYCGNTAAYASGFFRPVPTPPHIQGYHGVQQYHPGNQWNGSGRVHGGGGPVNLFPAMIL